MKNKLISCLLNGLASFPLALLYLFADIITPVLYHVVRYRRKVVRANLTQSFPDKDLKEIKKIEKQFYRYLGDQIIETLKLLNISDKELKKRVRVINYERVNESVENSRNAVLFMGHYANWEWAQEITRYFTPNAFMTTIYHTLSNKTWDDLFLKLRSRWKAHLVPMEQAPRVLLNKNHMPWICGFISDAWTYHKNENNRIEFLNHDTWFIYGSEQIGTKANSDFFYLEMIRKKRGHYDIIFHPLIPEDITEPFPYTRQFWKEFEKTIKKAPAYWLWSHKRWK